jgi:hypothetical protein
LFGIEISDKEELEEGEYQQRGALGKLHNIAVHSRAPNRIQDFQDEAGKLLPLNNNTR